MQKTAYEMRISDWSSDVCSSDLIAGHEKLLAKKRSANSLGTRGFSQIIMGTIARDAKKRDLACSAWRQAVRDFPDLEKRDELLGYYKEFLPGLRANVTKCDAGRSVGDLDRKRVV